MAFSATGHALDLKMIYFAAAIYAVVFWLIAFRRPAVALALIFASAPFQNDLSGGGGVKFSIAEINLLLTLPVLFLRAPRLTIGPVLLPVALYLGVCVCSSVLHWRPTALVSFVQMALYLLVAVMVFASLPRDAGDLRLAFHGLLITAVFLGIVVVATRSNYVLGLHKNGIGASLSCALIVGLELWFAAEPGRRRWCLVGALAVIGAGLLVSLSRGAWLGAFCGAGVLFLLRRQFMLFGRAALFLVPVIAIAWNFLPQGSRETATGFERGRRNIEARFESIDRAREFFKRDPLVGAGVGLRKEFDATNILWLTLAETGVLGAATLLLIHAVFLRSVWRAHRAVEIDDELFSLLAIGAALIVGRFAHGLVDHYWSRGAIMMAWAAAGMATFANWEIRRRLADDNEDEDDNEGEDQGELAAPEGGRIG